MDIKLPEFPKIQIKQDTSLPKESSLAGFEAMIWIMDDSDATTPIQTAAGRHGGDSRPLASLLAGLDKGLLRLPKMRNPACLSQAGQRHVVLRTGTQRDGYKALQLAREAVASVLTEYPSRIAVISLLGDRDRGESMAEALVAALHAALFPLPRLGKPADPAAPVQALHFFGLEGAPDLARAEATAEGNNLARWLTHLPPNYLTPGQYRQLAQNLAEREGWKSHFHDRKALEKLGAGAFLSVVQGSPNDDAGILKLSYRPADDKGQAPLSLVGKGICFDTGGTNLKNANGMLGMHGDMQGSAVAMGTLLALSRVGFPHPVDCWLALAENHIGSRASKCNDVVTALNGTTIEIINTDAEGRMVLADTLALASRDRPRAILDYATLTGSCVAALGNRMSGAMSNRPDWIGPLIETGQRCGERVWPLPYAEDYDEDLKSEVADVLQCRPPAEADHLYAARLLGRFVDAEIGWVHVDMSSGQRKGGLGHIPSEVIGFGVRFGLEWFDYLGSTDQ